VKAIGKGLWSKGFIAMLFTERYVAGRSMNSLVRGLARHGAEVSPATLAGACAQAGALLAPLAEAIIARSRGSWHLHADETTWRVFAPREGDGPARWWLWVFLGPDTVCFVMDPTSSGAVLARHAGIEQKTGQLSADEDGGPRRGGHLQRFLRGVPVCGEESRQPGQPVRHCQLMWNGLSSDAVNWCGGVLGLLVFVGPACVGGGRLGLPVFAV